MTITLSSNESKTFNCSDFNLPVIESLDITGAPFGVSTDAGTFTFGADTLMVSGIQLIDFTITNYTDSKQNYAMMIG